MLRWELKEIELPLRFNWAIARYSTKKKKNFIIRVFEDDFEGVGEVAWSLRFGESEKAIREGFGLFCKECPPCIKGVEGLIHLLDEISLPNSLKFGLESAYTHFLSQLSQRPIHKLLGINTLRTVETSFSVPIMALSKVENFIKNENLARFHALKIKLTGGEYDEKVLNIVKMLYVGNIYLDGNESFKSGKQFFSFLEKIVDYPIELIEQPFPAHFHEEYRELKKKSPFPIFADESISSETVTDYYAEHFDGINIKLMKSGGYFRALMQIKEAKERGLKVLLGCMIESSLGISGAMAIADKANYLDLDGFLFLKKDPYGFIQEENGKLFLSNIH